MSDSRELQWTRTTKAVLRWVDFYSRRVPPGTAKARREELISDMYEQHPDAARRGLPVRAVNRSIAFRAILGIFADISWGRIHNDPKVGTMAAARETNPADRALTRLAKSIDPCSDE
jgi:hypothetical protein